MHLNRGEIAADTKHFKAAAVADRSESRIIVEEPKIQLDGCTVEERHSFPVLIIWIHSCDNKA